jgi:carboxymethylenebutenolidase
MCHEPDSRPPAPPVIGEIDSTGSLELTATDGNVFAAYEAIPVGEPRAHVVILPDIRGLHPYNRALAERFAEAGVYAVAIDYFGRTAGAAMRDDIFDWQAHIGQVQPGQVALDVAATVRHLSPEGSVAVFTVGFCFGGGHSWRLAAGDLGLSGVVGFYGRSSLLAEVENEVTAPLLMLLAGADQSLPPADAQAVAARLVQRGRKVEVHVYEGAPHGFFDRSFAEHERACADAWNRMLEFFDRHGAAARQA